MSKSLTFCLILIVTVPVWNKALTMIKVNKMWHLLFNVMKNLSLVKKLTD